MKRLLPYVVMSAVAGAAAVLLPAIISPSPFATSLWRAPIEQPSVWAFQGLFVIGFVLALTAKLDLIDLPLLALSMVAVFPIVAGVQLARGSTLIDWPREFYLYAAWLIPALVGLVVGRTIRVFQERTRKASKR